MAELQGCDQIIAEECVQALAALPAGSVDCVFADPPYNLQLGAGLARASGTPVAGVQDDWDRFEEAGSYEAFTRAWLSAVKRVLKDNGTIWVIGSYHCIYTIGYVMRELDFWFLNDVHWVKTNPMPNMRGTRFQNATETMLWAHKRGARGITFNHHLMKGLNEGRQMRNVWELPICTGAERLRAPDGRKAHPTQKPLALLYRVIAASTRPGDTVLDPFFGTGTTGVAARRLGRRFIGIERDPAYAEIARARCAEAVPADDAAALLEVASPRKARQVPFPRLVEAGLVPVGAELVSRCGHHRARVRADGALVCGERAGSIHALGRELSAAASCNGWDYWRIEREGTWVPLDSLRAVYAQSSGDQVST